MKKIVIYIGIFLFFYGLKYFFDNILITDSFLLTLLIEIPATFIFSFVLFVFNDKSRIIEDKVKNNLYLAIFFSTFSFVVYFFKTRFNFHIINFLQYLTLFLLIVFRDYYIYFKRSKKDYIFYVILISFFLSYKYILNYLSKSIELDHNLFFALIPIIVNFIYSSVYSFFVTGNIEFDGNSYFVFEEFKVGRKKEFDIYIDENINNKKLFFSLLEKKNQILIKPYLPLQVDNNKVTEKTPLEEGSTIKLENNYFTFSYDKGSFVKRFFFLLLFISINIFIFPEIINYENSNFFSDFSDYPYIKLYTVVDNEEIFFTKKSNQFFIGEIDQFIEPKKVEIIKKIKISLYLILDATGNMPQRYKEFIPHINYFFETLKNNEKEIVINITTFADEKEDMKFFRDIKNAKQLENTINNIKTINGMDYPENPFDAIVNTKITKDDSLKVFFLFTDAPPHKKGDRGKDGVLDFTDQDTKSVKKFIEDNNILMFVASYERFTDYNELYNNMKYRFFEIENIDNFGNIIISLSKNLSKTLLFKYKSYQNLNNIKNNIVIFTGEDAYIKRKIFLKRNLKKRTFLRAFFQEF